MRAAVTALQNAISFLTVLPFPCPMVGTRSADQMARSMAWFPLVGALIGAVGAGTLWLISLRWSGAVAALLGLAAMTVLTGGLHLDGFSDTLDGLAAWKGREETLRIMRDSRIGVMGAAGIFFLLGLKWLLLQDLLSRGILSILVAVCTLSRLSMVLSAQAFPYVPGKTGLGRLATDTRSPRSVWMALLLGIVIACFSLGPLEGLLCLAASVAVTWGFNLLCLSRLGGITGDTLGAVNEMVEVSLLLLLGAVR